MARAGIDAITGRCTHENFGAHIAVPDLRTNMPQPADAGYARAIRRHVHGATLVASRRHDQHIARRQLPDDILILGRADVRSIRRAAEAHVDKPRRMSVVRHPGNIDTGRPQHGGDDVRIKATAFSQHADRKN